MGLGGMLVLFSCWERRRGRGGEIVSEGGGVNNGVLYFTY